MTTVYIWLLCYAPRWVVRCLPRGWRREQMRRLLDRYTSAV